MTPAAAPWLSTGKRRAAAPINTEKLPAPDPMADSRPRDRIRPNPESMKGVMALPRAISPSPPINTARGP